MCPLGKRAYSNPTGARPALSEVLYFATCRPLVIHDGTMRSLKSAPVAVGKCGSEVVKKESVMDERRAGQIRIERGASKKHYSVIMTAPDGSVPSVVVERTSDNGSALEYFFDRLKDGLAV